MCWFFKNEMIIKLCFNCIITQYGHVIYKIERSKQRKSKQEHVILDCNVSNYAITFSSLITLVNYA